MGGLRHLDLCNYKYVSDPISGTPSILPIYFPLRSPSQQAHIHSRSLLISIYSHLRL